MATREPTAIPNGPGVDSIAVERLTLTDFRCYSRLRLDPEPGLLVFTGPNGAGKTNLLEAVSLLVPGRGLRRARLRDMVRESAPAGWAVAARMATATGAVDLGTGLEAAASEDERDRRVVRIDGESGRAQAALAEHVAAHWLTPQMDRLFTEAPSGRRRFLDRLVYGWDAAHASRVAAYENAMRQRQKLLRDETGPADPDWLSSLEATMAEKAVSVAAARREVVANLNGICAKPVAPFPEVECAIEGDLEAWLADGPALAAEDRYRRALAENRRRDGEAGRTGTGPHRSDLRVRHKPKQQWAEKCSTGEQKALLISLVLGNARLRAEQQGAVPLLLLDEIAAHLDEDRRQALMDQLFGLGGQVWLTGTEPSLFASLEGRAAFYRIENATVVAAP